MGTSEILSTIDSKKEWIERHRPLPETAVQSLREDFVIRYAHNTTALEGNTLTLRETQVIIESGMVISGKPLREHLEVINVAEALRWVDDLVARGRSLCEDDIRALHSLLMDKLVDHPGAYRTERVFIRGAMHVPSNPLRVPELMAELASDLDSPARDEHPVAHAARIHHRLVQIHPWADGNGRTARMLSSVLAMRAGYPPPMYEATSRQLYLEALGKADLGRLDDFVTLTAQAIEIMEDRYLTILRPLGPADGLDSHA
jgi:Fic family protein